MKMSAMDWVVWLLLFIGGLNWGLVGLFKFDLINSITGGSIDYKVSEAISTFGMIIYILVGLAAVWSLFTMFSKGGKDNSAGM